MDFLELRREPAPTEADDDRVSVSVNGLDFIALVRESELASATASGEPDLAGDYEWLTHWEWSEIGALLEDKPSKALMADGRVALLGCACGITDCWPLYARLEIAGETVRVSDFLLPYRIWRHDGLGPFVFERAQMHAAIKGVLGAGSQ
jgi:hypothetical protein